MNNGVSLVKKGQVESVKDTADGLRIKVRIKEDGTTPLDKLPYAFPFLPKTFQSVPKEGEGALVLTTMSGSKESQRYYIGPIISQPQFQGKCDYSYGRGNAMSLIDGGVVEPLERISNHEETFGSFPNVDDVAIVGRGTQDIILRNDDISNEVDIRCGIRKGSDSGNDVKGSVVFNSKDPSYIQLKYKKGITKLYDQEANSVINMVADKINIISNQDEHKFKLTDPDKLIDENDLDKIMSELHQLPHGDTLVKLLHIIIMAVLTHVHPYAGMPATIAGYTLDMASFNVEDILSKHVRIS